VLTSWVGEQTAGAGRALLNAAGLATYETPGLAVSAFMQLVSYRRNQMLLMETPPSVPDAFEPDSAAAQEILARHLTEHGSGWLSGEETARVLDAFGIPTVQARQAASAEEAGELAAEFGVPVAIKILSPQITHKSDVGGVVLDVLGKEAVVNATERMLDHVSRVLPEARLDGVTIQPMIQRARAHELIIGMHTDPQFGPVLLFGQGGKAVEVVRDTALGLPPLNLNLAKEIMERTRVHELLLGYRDQPAADLEAIAMTLMRVSQLVVDCPEIETLDLNPLLADEAGVIVLDARISVRPSESENRTAHLAICPYPKELESRLELKDGRNLELRPIVPEDEPALHAGFAKLTPEEIRLRFLVPMGFMTHMLAARFTQLDYDRDMALVLTDPGIPGTGEIYAVVRLSADPDNEQAEFAIIVRHEIAGQGVGRHLMERIIDYARSRGIHELWGVTLLANRAMRALSHSLGFTESPYDNDSSLIRLSLPLTAAGSP
jgi:acetyltransferase